MMVWAIYQIPPDPSVSDKNLINKCKMNIFEVYSSEDLMTGLTEEQTIKDGCGGMFYVPAHRILKCYKYIQLYNVLKISVINVFCIAI